MKPPFGGFVFGCREPIIGAYFTSIILWVRVP